MAIDVDQIIKKINDHRADFIFIHYSCESFDVKDRSLRITGLVVRNFNDRQDKSFEIVDTAEMLSIENDDISKRYKEIEVVMLENFFEYLDHFKMKNFIHWKMRNANYGFSAIEHRAEVLSCKKIIKLSDANKIDLSFLLSEKYGENYIGHPRLKKLIDKNSITNKDFLTGVQEAEAFENGEYRSLTRSTLRKVDCFESIMMKTIDNSLEVDTNFSLQKFVNKIKNHWLIFIIFFLGSIASVVALIR